MSIEEEVKKELEQMEEDQNYGDGTNFVQPQPGDNVYLFLPPWRGDDEPFWKRIDKHRNLPDGSGNRDGWVRCREPYGEDCSLCESVQELFDTDSDDDTEMAKKMKSSKRYGINVIALMIGDEKQEPEFGVVDFGPSIMKPLLKLWKGRWDNVVASWEGMMARPIKIEREGTGKYDTKYYDPQPWGDEVVDLTKFDLDFDQMYDLDGVFPDPNYSSPKQAFQLAKGEENFFDEDSQPIRTLEDRKEQESGGDTKEEDESGGEEEPADPEDILPGGDDDDDEDKSDDGGDDSGESAEDILPTDDGDEDDSDDVQEEADDDGDDGADSGSGDEDEDDDSSGSGEDLREDLTGAVDEETDDDLGSEEVDEDDLAGDGPDEADKSGIDDDDEDIEETVKDLIGEED